MLLNAIGALLISAAIIMLLWLLRGLFLTPIRGGENGEISVSVTVRGSCPELEQTVKALNWLRENGTLDARVIFCDMGADEETMAAARLLEASGQIDEIHTKRFADEREGAHRA